MKWFDEFKKQLDEKYQVVAKTKTGETFKSGVYDTKDKAQDMHWKLAKGNKHKSVETVKVDEEIEEIEQIEEISKEKTQKYLDRAVDDHSHQNMARRNTTGDQQKEFARKEKNRKTGIGRAVDRLTREEVELDEAVYSIKNTKTGQIYFHSKYPITKDNSRLKKIQAAGGDHIHATPHKDGKPMNEEVQHELQQGDTMSSMEQYLAAIEGQASFTTDLQEKTLTPAELKKREEVAQAMERENPGMDKSKKMAIATATAKKVAEETVEEAKAHTVPKTEKEKDLAKLAEPKDKITHADVMVGRGVKKEEVDLDEEQIDELSINKMMTYRSKATEKLGSDPAKDAKRKEGIRVSGMKVKAKLKSEEVEIEEEKKDLPFDAPYKKAEDPKKTDKSGAVHTPMSRARDLARQAMKKQVKENFDMDINDEEADQLIETVDFEQLAEISKATLGSYIKKAKGSAIGAAQVTGMGASMTGQKTQDKAEKKVQKRAAGINKAVDRLTSEEADLEEGMISYTDFMDKIKMHRKAGNKVVDDKYSDKKASYTTIDSEGQGRKVTHTTSGQKMENLGKVHGEDDEAAEAKPTEKRGRGRPAGSKSGVSKYNK